MQYKVVCGQDSKISDALETLKRKVELQCQEGWEPQGGVSIALKNYDWYYACQAMVK